MSNSTTATVPKKYSREQLYFELNRRAMCPATSIRFFPEQHREEWMTVASLRAELEANRATDTPQIREWREWELALAELAAELFPDRLFYRIVNRPPPAEGE